MAAALKTFFSPVLVRRLGADLARVHPSFPERAFVKAACRGLDGLELLDRGRHIAQALAAHLPAAYPEAVDILLRSLGPEHAGDELLGVGMAPFFYLPHTLFVAGHGLNDFDLSMQAQYELTKRFSAESSIRPYLIHSPERVFQWLEQWVRDPNPHVRRLVSEGTRLRLPWASRVPWLDKHPDRVLGLLEALKDDPSSMVRRSVANNLNDLGKIHPDLLIATASAWLRDAAAHHRQLVEHALRSAVKRGDVRALELLGYGGRPRVVVERATFSPRRIAIGGRVTFRFSLRSTSREPQNLLVDAAVHFVKARGATSPKVFKLTRLALAPRAIAELELSVSLAIHTTRVPRPGRHAVDVLVNGQALPAGWFDVTAAQA